MEGRELAVGIKRGNSSTGCKEGERERIEDYRGVTLTHIAYKIYAAVLAERLREEVESKGILPLSQRILRKRWGRLTKYMY